MDFFETVYQYYFIVVVVVVTGTTESLIHGAS